MAIAVAVVVQGQIIATNAAHVALETEFAARIETSPLGKDVRFLVAFRAFVEHWIAAVLRSDVTFDPQAVVKGRLNHFINFGRLAAFGTNKSKLIELRRVRVAVANQSSRNTSGI